MLIKNKHSFIFVFAFLKGSCTSLLDMKVSSQTPAKPFSREISFISCISSSNIFFHVLPFYLSIASLSFVNEINSFCISKVLWGVNQSFPYTQPIFQSFTNSHKVPISFSNSHPVLVCFSFWFFWLFQILDVMRIESSDQRSERRRWMTDRKKV